MSRAKTRNAQHGTPSRSIRIADKLWHETERAAQVAGVTRNQFILGVLKHAVHQVNQTQRDADDDER
jgi:hypothetical protein